MTLKQFQRQLKTWEKHMPSIANDIKMLADSFNLLKKNGDFKKIRTKKLKSDLDVFLSRYQSKYGAYTNYRKKASKRLERAKKERFEMLRLNEAYSEYSDEELLKKVNDELGRSVDKYIEKMRNINEMIDELFNNAVSSDEPRNELDYIQTMSINEQEKYLSELLGRDND